MDLLFRAQQVHRENFNANEIQRSTLLSVKTGGCSEDCGYCSQAARYSTETEREALMPLDEVIAAAQAAKDKGASRFCMGAAWRGPKDKDLAKVTEMIRAVKAWVCRPASPWACSRTARPTNSRTPASTTTTTISIPTPRSTDR
jgi:biotin synthase